MMITGITPQQFRAIVADVSRNTYHYNLRAEIGQEYRRADGTCTRFRARVVAAESGARMFPTDRTRSHAGARKSASGRRLTAACWHAYRDVLAAIFRLNSRASVRTAMASYVHQRGFMTHYPATADHNMGSDYAPVTMPELCDCHRYGISTHERG